MIKSVFTRMDLYQEIPKNSIGAEIGVARGLNAIYLNHIIKPSLLYLIDQWDENQPALDYSGQYNKHKINLKNRAKIKNYYKEVKKLFELHENVTVKRLRSDLWLESIEDNTLDWIYIDTSHQYNQTKKELDLSVKKVKKNGLICGHDFCVNPIWADGVIAPVIDLIQQQKIEMIAMSTEPLPSFMCKNNVE